MSLESAAAKMLLLFCSLIPASAQWDDPSAVRDRKIHLGPPDDVFGGQPADLETERPHSGFERLERSVARISRPSSDPAVGSAQGTVSVAELRHPLSGAEAGLIERARQYSAVGNHLKAIEILGEAIQSNPSMAYARSILGVEYLKIGEIQAAIPVLREAVALMPRLAANHSNLGYALCRTGNREAGEQELRQAIRLDGNSRKAHFLLGVILLDQGTEEARDHLLLAQTDASQARLALAVYYTRLGQDVAAQETLRGYLQSHASVDSTEAERWIARAAALFNPASAFGFPPRENPRQFVDMESTSRDQIESR